MGKQTKQEVKKPAVVQNVEEDSTDEEDNNKSAVELLAQVKQLRKSIKKETETKPQVQQQPKQMQNVEEARRQRMIELNKKRQENKGNVKQGKTVTKGKTASETPQKQEKQTTMKDRWNSNYHIVNLTFPTLIAKDSLIKKRKYQIKFVYSDETGRQRDATVRFGSVNGSDYIDNKDPTVKRKFALRYEGLSNAFDPNFWRFWLCNTEETLVQSYCNFIQKCHLLKH